MRKAIAGVFVLAVTAGWAAALVAQDVPSSASTVGTGRTARPARLPYTAEFRTTRVQTLADGSTITRETTDILARDSQGRTLNLSTTTPAGDGQRQFTSVNIHDPVAKTQTYWSVPGQRVVVSNTGAQGTVPPACSASAQPLMAWVADAQREKPKTEELGKQTFQGIEAFGHRTTFTYPPGTIGNSDLLVNSSEVWFSTTPGLEGINVRQVSEDPRTGRDTRELVRFTQGEPDASLFQPPQDYSVETREIHNEVRCP
jgi:hypothetical protein